MGYPKLPGCMTQFGMVGTCVTAAEHPRPILVQLDSVRTQVTIRGFVAQVRATMVYSNTSSDPLEVKYQLPVDESAAVYKFEARLDGRTIIAQCMEKKKAEKVYEEAVSAGKTAVLARENELASDILHFALGNFPPESQMEVELGMVMELSVGSDGGVSFVLPTVLNPRYCPASVVHERDFDYMDDVRIVYAPSEYSINIEGHVSGSHQIARIISHTDPVNVDISEDTKSAKVSQDEGFKSDHDWSMVVYYSNPYQIHVLRETGDHSGTGIMRDDLIMVNLFPEVPASSYCNRNEIIFVIDRSGSMHSKMDSTRSALLLFLKSLPQGCYFNIVSFGSHYKLLFPEGSRDYNAENLRVACKLQKKMNSDMGGTEILEPLKAIYSKSPKPGYCRQILLISDGEVWNVQEVTDLVGRHVHETRVFSVGIGEGASTALIRGVARAGKGRSEMVYKEKELQLKVMGLVTSMLQENVEGVTVSCRIEPPTRFTLVPKVPPIIFGGHHLTLYARVPSDTTVHEVCVKGSVGGQKELCATAQGADILRLHDGEMSLHRLAARSQILQWQLDGDDEVVQDLVELSLASGVVSRHTALVGVDQDTHTALNPWVGENSGSEIWMRDVGSGMARVRGIGTTQSAETAGNRVLDAMLVEGKSEVVADDGCTGSSPLFGFLSSKPILQNYRSCSRAGPCSPPAMNLKKKNKMPHCVTSLQGNLRDEETYVCGSKLGEQSDSPASLGLLDVVQLQCFDGSWTLEEAARLCNTTLEKLTASNPSKSNSVWSTAVVLVLLERKFSEDREMWSLLAMKARGFIASSCSEDVQGLIQSAQAFLDSLPVAE